MNSESVSVKIADCFFFPSEFAKSHNLHYLHYVNKNGFPVGKKCVLYSVRPKIYRKSNFLSQPSHNNSHPHTKNVISRLSLSPFSDKRIFFQLHVYWRIVTFNGQVRLIIGECIYWMDIARREISSGFREIEWSRYVIWCPTQFCKHGELIFQFHLGRLKIHLKMLQYPRTVT